MTTFSEINKSDETYSKEQYVTLDIGQYRKDYPAVTKAFDNEQLFNIVMSTDDDMDADGWVALFKAKALELNEPNLNVDSGIVEAITARKGHVQALAFAAKGGSALNNLLASIADQKAAERMGSIRAMCFMVSNYSDDETHAIPVVGSKQGKIEDGGTGNKPYDRYSAPVTTPQGKRMVPASWFTDVIKSTDEWQRIQQLIAFLDGEEPAEGLLVPDSYAGMRKTGEAEATKQTLRDRVSDMRTGLTKGAMLFHHCEEIRTLNPDRIAVKMPWRMERVIGPDGQPVKVPGTNEYQMQRVVYGSKIKLQDPTGENDDKVYSVSSFLQIKPEVVADLPMEQRTIVKLDDTTTRAPRGADKGKTGAQEGANAAKIPTTVEGGLTLFNALASWMDTETDSGMKVYTSLLEACAKEGPAGDETVISVGKVCLALDALWTVINPRYTRIQEEKTRAALASRGEGRTSQTQAK